MSAGLTRRAALSGAVASAAVVGVTGAAAMPVIVPVVDAWERAKAAYLKAKAAEDWHDEHVAMPAFKGDMKASLPDYVAAECDRLCDARFDAEACLMDTPSPHAIAFAFKYLIAHGEGRETDCWDEMLEAEATRFVVEA